MLPFRLENNQFRFKYTFKDILLAFNQLVIFFFKSVLINLVFEIY